MRNISKSDFKIIAMFFLIFSFLKKRNSITNKLEILHVAMYGYELGNRGIIFPLTLVAQENLNAHTVTCRSNIYSMKTLIAVLLRFITTRILRSRSDTTSILWDPSVESFMVIYNGILCTV